MPTEGIKNWPEDESPRERLLKYGPDKLSESQLLAIILATGDKNSGRSALDLGRLLIKEFGSLQDIDACSIAELCAIPGIGLAKASQIKAAFELGKRLLSEKDGVREQFKTSVEVANYYIPRMTNVKKEVFKSLLLNSKNKIIKEVIISEGSLNYSIVHPREAFNPAIKESAAAVIFIHNHPSGDPTPSTEDLEITKRLKKVSEIVGIKLLDHIIIGDNSYFSFVDEQLL